MNFKGNLPNHLLSTLSSTPQSHQQATSQHPTNHETMDKSALQNNEPFAPAHQENANPGHTSTNTTNNHTSAPDTNREVPSNQDASSSAESATVTPRINPWITNSASTTTVKSNSLSQIMAEQQSQSESHNNNRSRVKFNTEGEEERMMRLAIEASLRDQEQRYNNDNSAKSDGSGKSHHVSFAGHVSFANPPAPIEDDLDEDMKRAIALSLQEAEAGGGGERHVNFFDKNMAAICSSNDVEMGAGEDDRKPAAVESAGEAMPESVDVDKDMSDSAFVTMREHAFATTTEAIPAAAASYPDSMTDQDESEQLAQALYEAELASTSAAIQHGDIVRCNTSQQHRIQRKQLVGEQFPLQCHRGHIRTSHPHPNNKPHPHHQRIQL
jgi:hypothetical protein